jgi:hypothetical protein
MNVCWRRAFVRPQGEVIQTALSQLLVAAPVTTWDRDVLTKE